MTAVQKWVLILIPILGLLVMGSMFGSIGVSPKVLPLIKPSKFSDHESLGFWAYRQTRPKTFRTKLVVWGLNPNDENSEALLRAFVETSKRENPVFEIVLSEVPLSFHIPNLIHHPTTFGEKENQALESLETVAELIRNRTDQNLGSVIVVSASRSSKLVKTSLSTELETRFGLRLSSFTTLYQTPQDLDALTDFCSDLRPRDSGIDFLRCFFWDKRKKFEKLINLNGVGPGKVFGGVDQTAQDDYLVYIYSQN